MYNIPEQLRFELERLIAFKPVTGASEQVNLLFDYLEAELQQLGLQVKRDESNGFPNIVAGTKSLQKSHILLQAHVDVVPAEPSQFRLTESDGKLYGRGTYDMLFGAACFLVLLRELKGDLHNHDIGVMFTSDEEVGGTNGVYKLLQDYNCDVCILPDAGSDTELCVGSKGILQLDVKATGVAAHSSRPSAGVNPITKLNAFITELQQTYPNNDEAQTTCVVTRFHSGDAHNQIPHAAVVSLDIRYHPDDTADTIQQQITELAEKHADVMVRRHEHGFPARIPKNDPYIEAYKQLVGPELAEIIEQGSSDARFFADKNIPVIMQRPRGGGLHGEAEWVDTESLSKFYKTLKSYLLQQQK